MRDRSVSNRTSRSLAATAVLGVALGLSGAAPSAGGDERALSLRVDVQGEDGERVSFSISSSGLAGLISRADFDLDCEGADDRQTRRMMALLDEKGDGAIYRGEDDDGDPLVGRRRGGRLLIESRDDDGERAEIEMPWPLAECLLLGREPEGGLRRALARGDLEFRIDARDEGGRVRISIGDD
jgi:hypothetical protein